MYVIPISFYSIIPEISGTIIDSSGVNANVQKCQVTILKNGLRLAADYLSSDIETISYTTIPNSTSTWTKVSIYNHTGTPQAVNSSCLGLDGQLHKIFGKTTGLGCMHARTTDDGETWIVSDTSLIWSLERGTGISPRADGTFFCASGKQVFYTTDTTGDSSWNEIFDCPTSTAAGNTTTALILSRPALIRNLGTVITYFLADNDGSLLSDWQSGGNTVIQTVGSFTSSPVITSLTSIDGNPAFIAVDLINNLHYYRSTTTDGSGAWSGSVIQTDANASQATVLQDGSMTVVINGSGFPVIGYHTSTGFKVIVNNQTDGLGTWSILFDNNTISTPNIGSTDVQYFNNKVRFVDFRTEDIKIYF